MSYAIDTTKRKFHRILDSITNPSKTSLVEDLPLGSSNNESTNSLASSLDQSVKRRRILRPQSLAADSPSRAILERIENERAIAASAKNASSIQLKAPLPKSAPTFAPWDRTQFLQRLKSFSEPPIYDWRPKKDRIDEKAWALRGWKYVDTERVRCVSCHQEVYISVGDTDNVEAPTDDSEESGRLDWKEAAQEELVNRYEKMIITGHSEGCSWRTRACDATIHRLPLTNPTDTLESLRTRYQSLLKIKEALPASITVPEEIDVGNVAQDFAAVCLQNSLAHPASASASASSPQAVDIDALSLALFGWWGENPEGIGNLATCNACFRRNGLWLWLPRRRPSGEVLEPCVEKLRVADEHRYYCPWINAASQNGPKRSDNRQKSSSDVNGNGAATTTYRSNNQSYQAGWEMLLQILRNAHALQRTRQQHSTNPSSPTRGSRPIATGPEEMTTAADATAPHLEASGFSEDHVVDPQIKEAKDKERWVKLRRLKSVFQINKKAKVDAEVQKKPRPRSMV